MDLARVVCGWLWLWLRLLPLLLLLGVCVCVCPSSWEGGPGPGPGPGGSGWCPERLGSMCTVVARSDARKIAWFLSR